MEAESHNWSNFRTGAEGWTEYWVVVPKCALRYASEVKIDHAHIITQDICNKFIVITFSVGCMVCPWLRLLHHQLPVKLLIRRFNEGIWDPAWSALDPRNI